MRASDANDPTQNPQAGEQRRDIKKPQVQQNSEENARNRVDRRAAETEDKTGGAAAPSTGRRRRMQKRMAQQKQKCEKDTSQRGRYAISAVRDGISAVRCLAGYCWGMRRRVTLVALRARAGSSAQRGRSVVGGARLFFLRVRLCSAFVLIIHRHRPSSVPPVRDRTRDPFCRAKIRCAKVRYCAVKEAGRRRRRNRPGTTRGGDHAAVESLRLPSSAAVP